MGTTLNRAYRYPSSPTTDPNNPPLHFQQLAEDLDADVQALDDATQALHDDTGWIAMTLLNGWVNFSVAYAPAAYRRRNGVTWITGIIKSGVSSAGQAIANLPGGFRPTGMIMRGTVGASGAVALEFDGATGNLQQGPSGASPTWTVLDMNFPADA